MCQECVSYWRQESVWMPVMGQQVITKHFTGLLAMGMLTLLSFCVVRINCLVQFIVLFQKCPWWVGVYSNKLSLTAKYCNYTCTLRCLRKYPYPYPQGVFMLKPYPHSGTIPLYFSILVVDFWDFIPLGISSNPPWDWYGYFPGLALLQSPWSIV